MEITWLGHSCFRLRGRDVVVLTDPFPKRGAFSIGKVTADVVTVSHEHKAHAYVAGVGGQPHVVKGPGEYEVKGAFITGIRTYHDAEKGARRGKNTTYLVEMDDLVVCHLGDLGHMLASDQVELMSNVDILLVPVGGGTTINAAQAAEVISLIEPKVVIPMHFRQSPDDNDIEPVDKFLRELSVSSPTPQAKAQITKSNLPEETQVILLEVR